MSSLEGSAPAPPISPAEAQGVADIHLELVCPNSNAHITGFYIKGHCHLHQDVIAGICIHIPNVPGSELMAFLWHALGAAQKLLQTGAIALPV